jgi:hypothetical protein
LPSGVNITTAVGDCAEFECDTANNWKLINYTLAGLIHNSPGKTTPVGADEVCIWDSVTGLLKKVTFTSIDSTWVANDTRAKTALNVTVGASPIYANRTWVNFNGITVTARGSGNISSITDNGVGDYTTNFTASMGDANYVIVPAVGNDATTAPNISIVDIQAGYVRIATANASGTKIDSTYVCLTIVR